MKVIYDKILEELREDDAAGNGGFGLIADTYTNILTLQTGKTLKAGWGYVITDRADVGIRLFAERVDDTGLSNQLSLAGSGGFLNPDFQNKGDYSGINASTGIGTYLGDWNAGLACAMGDIVKNTGVNNLFYVNLTGFNGGSSPDSDTTNWVTIIIGSSPVYGNGFPTPNVWQQADVTGFMLAHPGFNGNIIVIWNNYHWVLRNPGALNGLSPDNNDFASGGAWQKLDKTLTNFNNGTGYIQEWDAIEYDFTNDYINKRTDKRNNAVDSNAQLPDTISNFQWGNDNVNNNKCINTALISCANNAGVVDSNTLVDYTQGSQLYVDNTNTGSVFSNFITNNSFLEIANNIGSIESNHLVCESYITIVENLGDIGANFFSGSEIEIDMDVGCSMDSNNFFNATFNVVKTGGTQFAGNSMSVYSYDETCNSDVDDINKTYIDGLSTFEATIDITDAATIDLTGMNYVGIFNLTSVNPTESVSDITLPFALRSNQFSMFPASGLTVTFNGTAIASIAAGEIALPTSTITINGTNQGWIEFMPDRDNVGYSLMVAHHFYI